MFMDIVLVIVSYLLGNISTATIIGKINGINVKKEGSGNAGTTNAYRLMGAKAGALTLVGDVLKGSLAAGLGRYFGSSDLVLFFCCLAVFLGHIWPVFLKFKGGKGVATAFGLLIVAMPKIALLLLGVVLVCFIVFKKVSVASLVGCVAFVVAVFFYQVELYWLIFPALIIFTHRSNIKRLIKGEEKKLVKEK